MSSTRAVLGVTHQGGGHLAAYSELAQAVMETEEPRPAVGTVKTQATGGVILAVSKSKGRRPMSEPRQAGTELVLTQPLFSLDSQRIGEGHPGQGGPSACLVIPNILTEHSELRLTRHMDTQSSHHPSCVSWPLVHQEEEGTELGSLADTRPQRATPLLAPAEHRLALDNHHGRMSH